MTPIFNEVYSTDDGIGMARSAFYSIGVIKDQSGQTVLSLGLPERDSPVRFLLSEAQRQHLVSLLLDGGELAAEPRG
ncbi:hypothetical protein [Chromobacterium haemolyticum]|nr:hypothetical protein [Chromobacterium haemolyticum]